MGMSIFEISKIDFNTFHYMSGQTETLVREYFIDLRGNSIKSEIGYVIKVARENLHNFLTLQKKQWEFLLDKLLDTYQVDDLISFVTSEEEYQKVNAILKKSNLKVHYPLPDKEEEDESKVDQDPFNPDKYNSLEQWNERPEPKI